MEDPLVSFAVSWVILHVMSVKWVQRTLSTLGTSLNFLNHDYVFVVTYMFLCDISHLLMVL